jgi:hypothetical protein
MRFELDNYRRNTPESVLIADLRRVASELGKKSVSRREYTRLGRFAYSCLEKRLGGWSGAVEKAELEEAKVPKKIRDEELFRNLELVWTRLGRQPRRAELRSQGSAYGERTYEKRFGSWRNALEAFISYVNGEEGAASDDETESLRADTVPRRKAPRGTKDDEASLSGGTAEGSKDEPIADTRGPRYPGRKLILQVVMRDNGICQICKRAFTESGPDYHIDHIIAWTRGGPTILSNLQLLCSKCNLLKGAIDLTNGTGIEVQNAKA